jgi:hypothetical protein
MQRSSPWPWPRARFRTSADLFVGCRYPVANTGLGEYVTRVSSVGLDLAPDPLNGGPHVIGFSSRTVRPTPIERSGSIGVPGTG